MSLHPECLAEFKLNKPPFDALPNEDFVYTDPELERLIESAAASLTAPNVLLTLTGDSGSGRSVQLMRLLGLLSAEAELIAFRARPNTTFEAVDFTIRTHLRQGGHDDPNRSLTELLAARVRAGFDPVIAIDDAHQLGTDIIDLLLRMRTEIIALTSHGPRFVLSGDGGPLRRRLRLEPHDEANLVRFHLRAFSLTQTAAYLNHRLRAAGMTDPGALLTETVVNDLQAASGGLPEHLNQHANDWLEKVCHLRRRRAAVRATDDEPLSAGGSAAGSGREPAAAALAAQWAPGSANTEHADAAPAATSAASLRADPDERNVRDPREPRAPTNPIDPDWRDFAEPPGHPQDGRDNDTLDAQDDDPREAATPIWNQRWFVPLVALLVAALILTPLLGRLWERQPPRPDPMELALPFPPAPRIEAIDLRAPVTDPDTAEPHDGAPPELREDLRDILFDPRPVAEIPDEPRLPAAMPTPAATPSSVARPAPAPTPAPVTTPAPRTVVSPPPAEPTTRPEPAPITRPSSTPPPPATPSAAQPPEPPPASPAPRTLAMMSTAEDLSWLHRQNRQNYTIQLLAAPDLEAAQRFVERHRLSGIRYIETRSGGRDFVVAIAGSFSQRAAAETAREELPAAVKDDHPWVRSIGSLLDVLR